MRGKNPKVMHSKDRTESQNESPENGNTESHDKRPIYQILIGHTFLEWIKFKESADSSLNKSYLVLFHYRINKP